MIEEQKVDIPCPVCFKTGDVNMIAHVSEIPYFGEHTQVTVMCHSCGWRQTDFIPAEGKKAGGWSLVIKNEENLKSRVVRSSSCTVKIEELDLQVSLEVVQLVMFPTLKVYLTDSWKLSKWFYKTFKMILRITMKIYQD